MKKTVLLFSLAVGAMAFVSSCAKHDENSPGIEFMPDMYRSPSYESNMAYVKRSNGDTISANRLPAEGTIPRGFMPYPYPNTADGYNEAGLNLHNPLTVNDANVKTGEELYGKFCVHCHGAAGQGDGAVGLKLPGAPPSYTSAAIMALPEGKMFHSITYGRGLMGSHTTQLNKEERWKVIMYIHKLQYPNGMPTAVVDSTAAKKEIKAKKK
jgi:mono/diheme cytochrome c family protein